MNIECKEMYIKWHSVVRGSAKFPHPRDYFYPGYVATTNHLAKRSKKILLSYFFMV